MNQLGDALNILEENGYKLTQKRQLMLTIFHEQNKYLTARVVQQHMLKEFNTISPDTIYRNLYTFVELGILEMTELEGEKIFRFSCHVHNDHHHHHFICTKCGMTQELSSCPMEYIKDQLPKCSIQSHRFDVFGLCHHCQ